jgi:hypothetical protein
MLFSLPLTLKRQQSWERVQQQSAATAPHNTDPYVTAKVLWPASMTPIDRFVPRWHVRDHARGSSSPTMVSGGRGYKGTLVDLQLVAITVASACACQASSFSGRIHCPSYRSCT